MNKPGHVLTGITFVALYQKVGFIELDKIMPFIKFENFIFYYNNTLFYPIWKVLILVILAIIGSVIPDIDLKLKYLFNDEKGEKRYLYHRQITHSLILWLLIFFYSSYSQNIYLFYFALGGISHLFGDMITGSVPVLLWGKYYTPFARIGVDRIYKNPKFYSKFANFLDKAMIFVTGFSLAIVALK